MNYTNLLIIPLVPGNPTDEEILFAIRTYRNNELQASDWTQLPDIETDKVDVAAWRVYRQQLRDMLDQGVPPKEIVFPTPPV